ncbi:NIPA-like protein 2 [Microtus ochrogaster]|uniref:NIPA-like protein 2 n=1 Tax=Microtus ochrogaster TaxID=79684 RepID=A0A8J6KYF0_MICOH|nr:NIPA-like protein 2 [Microtus ochrogaster]
MAAPVPTGPEDDASAVLDELSRNFTYWAPGPGNGSLSSAWYRRNQVHLFGVLLAILGNVVISISLNIQKYSHLHLAQKEHPKPYFRSALWWSGVLLMAVGETGNFAAYGIAPITLIAPLGCVSVTAKSFYWVVKVGQRGFLAFCSLQIVHFVGFALVSALCSFHEMSEESAWAASVATRKRAVCTVPHCTSSAYLMFSQLLGKHSGNSVRYELPCCRKRAVMPCEDGSRSCDCAVIAFAQNSH